MIAGEEDDDEQNGFVDEVIDNGGRNANGLLAEEYILGKLVPKTRRQYELCIIKMKAWVKKHHLEEYDTLTDEMRLPLSEDVVKEFLASVSKHRTKLNAEGAPSTVSISTINLYR